jgi:glycerophosphoryl diester phosphodiesterase
MNFPLLTAPHSRREFLGASLALGVSGMAGRAAEKNPPALPARGLCAHRGAMHTHPENTLPAFREALRLGAHMIEFDLQLTRDGALALMHDPTVNRTTNGKGKVADLTLAELRQLDAGVRHGKQFAGTRIPTFAETLAMMPRNVWLNCHLKGEAEAGAAAARVIVAAGRLSQAFLAATGAAAKGAAAVNPAILICNMDRRPNPADYVNETIGRKSAFIQLTGKGEVAVEHIRQLKANGVRVNYYEGATPDAVRRLFAAGVDFPLVNDLASFLPVAREFGIEPLRPLPV